MTATTDASGDVATAKPIPGYAANTGLPFQEYAVVELAKTSPIGTWTLDKVECTNVKEKPVRSDRLTGAAFTLTDKEPEVTCTFTNSFRAGPGRVEVGDARPEQGGLRSRWFACVGCGRSP